YREDLAVSVYVTWDADIEREVRQERRYPPVGVALSTSSHLAQWPEPEEDRALARTLPELHIDVVFDLDVSRYATDDPTKWHAPTSEQMRTMTEALQKEIRTAARSGCAAAGLPFTLEDSHAWRCGKKSARQRGRP